MARIITGQSYDLDDGSPLVDVDTAVLQLLDELSERPRVRTALAALINFASNEQQPWIVFENGSDVRREIEAMNRATRALVLKPLSVDGANLKVPPMPKPRRKKS
jgi:hypothetical protein